MCLSIISIFSCKDENNNNNGNNTVLETQILTDFAHILANPNYQDIQAKANTLRIAIQNLNNLSNEENLNLARIAWRETRSSWEKAEGYLFGPVDDYNYDPAMDDWPVNKVDLDSLLASNNPLTLSDIDALPTSLKGFHPIEYVLFGLGGSKIATQLTTREKLYMVSLSQSLYNTTSDLRNSWDVNQSGNFTNQLINAGNGSSRFATRKEAFILIATSMAEICDEVANGKMEEPLAALDSTLQESQFSHNSTADFKNNIIGIQNAYHSKFFDDGHGLNELIVSKNISLDNKIQSQITTALNSFNAINSNYGLAIHTQVVQIHNAQNAINALKVSLEDDLINFIQTNVHD
ncbi:MAG: imelysin family protein [Saprospiraceae bacterium]